LCGSSIVTQFFCGKLQARERGEAPGGRRRSRQCIDDCGTFERKAVDGARRTQQTEKEIACTKSLREVI